MQLVFLIIFCVKDTSSLDEHENAKEILVKKRSATFQWHENEYDSQDGRMLINHDSSNIYHAKRKVIDNNVENLKDLSNPIYQFPLSKVHQTTKVATGIAKALSKGNNFGIEAKDIIPNPKQVPNVKDRNKFNSRYSVFDRDGFVNESTEANDKSKRKQPKKKLKMMEDWKYVGFENTADTGTSQRKHSINKVRLTGEKKQVGLEVPVDTGTSKRKHYLNKIRLKEERSKQSKRKHSVNKVRVPEGRKQAGLEKAADTESEHSENKVNTKQVHFEKTVEMENAKLPTKQIQLSASQIQREPKKVYIKSKEGAKEDLIRKESSVDINITGSDLMKNVHRKSIPAPIVNKLPLLGFNAESLANVPKRTFDISVHPQDNTAIADELSKKIRILCWILTFPENHNRTCQPIKDTWGRRCTKLLFMSTEEDKSIPTVKLDVREGRSFLWPKVKAAFQYVHDHYIDQYDWFIRADDDTYMVVENLRYLLADFDPKDPMYFGCRFKHFSPQGFMSGGAGIAISNAALKKFVASYDSDICSVEIDWDLENDDVNMGVCFNRIGVKAMDSRDVAHKGRFLVFMPQDHISPTKIAGDRTFWYWKYVYYPTEVGKGCCSDYTISFHYVNPDDMYALEFLIYRIRPFGVEFANAPIPKILRNSTIEKNKKYITHEITTISPLHKQQYFVTKNFLRDSAEADTFFENNLGINEVLSDLNALADNGMAEPTRATNALKNNRTMKTVVKKLEPIVTEASGKSVDYEEIDEAVSEEEFTPKFNKYKTVL